MTTSVSDLSFRRYDIRKLSSFTPLMRNRSSGIYIFEFTNGQRYVGRTSDFASRFSQHVSGSNHHEPWEDIAWLLVADAGPAGLGKLELEVIAWQKQEGYSLRNKMFNLGFEGPSELDDSIPIIDQLHWALGDSDFDIQDIREAANRDAGEEPKLHRSAPGLKPWLNGSVEDDTYRNVADAVCGDLGAVIARAIPEAVELENIYWTVSDYPNTVGGRFATLNVGSLEVMHVPRNPLAAYRPDGTKLKVPYSRLNLAPGTLMDPDNGELKEQWRSTPTRLPFAMMRQNSYRLGEVDTLTAPTGLLGLALDDPEILQGVRRLCLDLMRLNQAGKFRRWHSPELARRAYKKHLEKIGDSS